MAKKLSITLKKSTIGRVPKHRSTVESLGLRKLNQTVVHEDRPEIRGMIKSIEYMLEVQEIEA